MTYEILKFDNGVLVRNPNGGEIYRHEGMGYYESEIQEAILGDANFGKPQKAALKSLLGLLDIEKRDGSLPNQ